MPNLLTFYFSNEKILIIIMKHIIKPIIIHLSYNSFDNKASKSTPG